MSFKRRKTPRRKGSWSKNVKKYTIDGIDFKSGIEKYMYLALKKEKLFEGYENETFQLMEGFHSENLYYARQNNGKGEFKQRNASKIRGVSYTPDFCGKDFIIETKGYATPDFTLRFKIFKSTLVDIDKRTIFVPRTQKECDLVIQLIKNSRL